MDNFNDKVIWITGASSGLGKSLAEELSQRGAKIILSGRDEEVLNKVGSRINKSKTVVFDISNPEILKEKVDEAISAFGHIDIIIHNAGVAQNSMAIDTFSDVENQILQIDYLSPVSITKYLLPHFIERKSGHIIVISGLLAFINLPGRSTYAAAKAALMGYFGCLRAEVKSMNINVSVIVPGSLSTNLVNKALTNDGSITKTTREASGYPLREASLKIAKSILSKKHQVYVGSRKEFMMWKLSSLFPNFIINKLLKR